MSWVTGFIAVADLNGFAAGRGHRQDCRDFVPGGPRVDQLVDRNRAQKRFLPALSRQTNCIPQLKEGLVMLCKKLVALAGAAVILTGVNVRTALAQGPIDSRTEFTFNAPVELPGVTLPAGTYVFRFADVMQVLSKNESNKTYGLFMTIAAQRPKPSDDAELRFLETPAGKPAAVKTWWYPGNTIGREFIYPRAQARRLATATNTTVLTTKSEKVPQSEVANADLTYVSPGGEESAVTPVTPNRAPVQEGTSAANSSPSRQSLPRTDTLLPLLALMGLSSLAGGAALRFRL
jgi:hypothetical protein